MQEQKGKVRDCLKIGGLASKYQSGELCAPGSKPLYKRKGSYRSLTGVLPKWVLGRHFDMKFCIHNFLLAVL